MYWDILLLLLLHVRVFVWVWVIPNLIRSNMCAHQYHIFHRFLYMQFQIKRTKFIMRWKQLASCWNSTIVSLRLRIRYTNWVRGFTLQ